MRVLHPGRLFCKWLRVYTMENKSKYLSELADLASPYFKKNFQSHKLLQPTASKFTANSLAVVFPDSSQRFIVKLEKKPKLRPNTANQNSAAILRIEKVGRIKSLSHSEKYQIIQKFISGLKHCQRLSEDLSLNFLQVSSDHTKHLEDSIIPQIPISRLTKDSIISECQRLTTELKSILSPTSQSQTVEILWRGLIKLLDYSLTLTDTICSSIKKDSEELSDYRISQIQQQFDHLSQTSSYKIQTQTEEIEKLQNRILSLEQELFFKSRIIADKNKKIEEMNTFDNKEFTMFKLSRMVKGLNDFIAETEKEHSFQEKIFGGISQIFEMGEKLTKPPENVEKESQTECAGDCFGFGFIEVDCISVFYSPIPRFLQDVASEKSFEKEFVLGFCLEVLRSELVASFHDCFLAKSIESGFSGSVVLEILRIVKASAASNESWAKTFQKLLGLDGHILGNLWRFLKFIDNTLKTQSNPFIDLESVNNLLYKGFTLETYKVHRVLYEIEIFEFSAEHKVFVKSTLKPVEHSLLKVLTEVKKKNLKLKTVLNNPASPGMISKGYFITFIQSLPLYITERSALDLWFFLTGSYGIEEYKIPNLITNMKSDHYSAILKTQYISKYDLLYKCVSEWEKMQEKLLGLLSTSTHLPNSYKILLKYLKEHKFDLPAEAGLEIFLYKSNPKSNLSLPSFSFLDFSSKKSRSKSTLKL